MWTMIELAQDPTLFQAIREEVLTTMSTDPSTGARSIDTQQLMGLPLLQSVFSETLRLHMSFNVMRQVKEPITMDGYTLPKGSMLQAPMQIAHLDPAVWSTEGHPADQFWAERHVKYTQSKDDSGNVVRKAQYSLAGRPSSFFPFGASLILIHSYDYESD
jgi:cytochrome P450